MENSVKVKTFVFPSSINEKDEAVINDFIKDNNIDVVALRLTQYQCMICFMMVMCVINGLNT